MQGGHKMRQSLWLTYLPKMPPGNCNFLISSRPEFPTSRRNEWMPGCLSFIQGLWKLSPNLPYQPYFPLDPVRAPGSLNLICIQLTTGWHCSAVLGMALWPPPDNQHTENKDCGFFITSSCQKPCLEQLDFHPFPPWELWIRSKDCVITQTKVAPQNHILGKSYREHGVFTPQTRHFTSPARRSLGIVESSLYL